jgi:LuxR family transcriptional regulator, quorum-sensing system regulator CviR
MLYKSDEMSEHISGDDALLLLEFIQNSLSCDSELGLKELFALIRNLFPFDFAGAEFGFHDNSGESIILKGMNISFPEQWAHDYHSRNYHQLSVLTKENFRVYRPQYIENTWKKHRQKQEIISLCLDYGIRSGYVHGASASAPGQKGSMFVFAGPNMSYESRTVAILELIVPHLHQAYARIMNKRISRNNRAILTGREREILNWLKQGKSSWDTSVILGISQSTVNFHITNIIRKLGACNRSQAIAIAIHKGIVSPV